MSIIKGKIKSMSNEINISTAIKNDRDPRIQTPTHSNKQLKMMSMCNAN